MSAIKIKTTEPVLDWNGDQILVQKTGGVDVEPITFGQIILQCVSTPLPGDGAISLPDKMRLYALGIDCAQGKNLVLGKEDIALLKERGAQTMNILPYGRLMEALEPVTPAKPKPKSVEKDDDDL